MSPSPSSPVPLHGGTETSSSTATTATAALATGNVVPMTTRATRTITPPTATATSTERGSTAGSVEEEQAESNSTRLLSPRDEGCDPKQDHNHQHHNENDGDNNSNNIIEDDETGATAEAEAARTAHHQQQEQQQQEQQPGLTVQQQEQQQHQAAEGPAEEGSWTTATQQQRPGTTHNNEDDGMTTPTVRRLERWRQPLWKRRWIRTKQALNLQQQNNNDEAATAALAADANKKKRDEEKRVARKLAKLLDLASEALLDRLFRYLSQLPEVLSEEEQETNHHNYHKFTQQQSTTTLSPSGIALPASAIGWLSSHLYPDDYDKHYFCADTTFLALHDDSEQNNDNEQQQPQRRQRTFTTDETILSASTTDRLALLKFLLPRLTHLRITTQKWPSKPKPWSAATSTNNNNNNNNNRSNRQRTMTEADWEQAMRLVAASAADASTEIAITTNADNNEPTAATATTTSPGLDSGDQSAEPSVSNIDQDTDNLILPSVSPTSSNSCIFSLFLEYFEALVNRPRVDLRLFPNLQVLLLDQVPLEWVVHPHPLFSVQTTKASFRHSLQVLRIERTGSFNFQSLFCPQTENQTQNLTQKKQQQQFHQQQQQTNAEEEERTDADFLNYQEELWQQTALASPATYHYNDETDDSKQNNMKQKPSSSSSSTMVSVVALQDPLQPPTPLQFKTKYVAIGDYDDDGAAADMFHNNNNNNNYHSTGTNRVSSSFPSLTHFKLCHCDLTDQAFTTTNNSQQQQPSESATAARPRQKQQQRNSKKGRHLEQQQQSPLARMLHLKFISLAHNQLSNHEAVLSALGQNKPFLSKIDLSHNYFTSFHKAHHYIGNIQVLNVSHNHLTTTAGLDRLYSLETLYLNHNQLLDVASIRGLARLDSLHTLTLHNNPLQTHRRLAYRVDVLDLFCKERLAFLVQQPEVVTFRQLQKALPTLDCRVATLGELKALRDRTYATVTVVPLPPPTWTLVENDDYVNISLNEENEKDDSKTKKTTPAADAALDAHGNTITEQEEEIKLKVSSSPRDLFKQKKKASNSSSSNNTKQKRKRRIAKVGDESSFLAPAVVGVMSAEGTSLAELDSVMSLQQRPSNAMPKISFTVMDVLQALVDDECRVRQNDDAQREATTAENQFAEGDTEDNRVGEGERSNDKDGDAAAAVDQEEIASRTRDKEYEDGVDEVIRVLTGKDELFVEKYAAFEPSTCTVWDEKVEALESKCDVKSKDILVEDNKECIPNVSAEDIDTSQKSEEKLKEEIKTPTKTYKNPFDDDYDGHLVLDPGATPKTDKDLETSTVSLVKREDEEQELKGSGATTATAVDSNLGSHGGPVSSGRVTPEPEEDGRKNEESTTAKESFDTKIQFQPPLAAGETSSAQAADDTISLSSSPSNNHRVPTYPGSLWRDDASSVHSAATSMRGGDDQSTTVVYCKYTYAEEQSTFDGPPIYGSLKILENLELYFRLFVFNYPGTSTNAGAFAPVGLGMNEGADEEDWRDVLDQYPKIQLWSIDISMRDAVKPEQLQFTAALGDSSNKEDLRRVWEERVVACGKPALKRLTPNRGARYGFHGELLWSAANTSHLSPEAVAEYREMIVCLSTTAIYFIVNHDVVTAKTKDRKRKFPLPVPQDSTFNEAKWPHAVARHSFRQLRGITIGFGFQRLTLRFSNSTFPSPDDYTYVLLTSNKMETVGLLKEIQQLTEEAKSLNTGGYVAAEEAITIENDDRHVLDALGVAVAPDVIGVILHYQILLQRWKSGERGTVRRVCVVSDTKLFLLDEDYVGDGSESVEAGSSRTLADTMYRLVDSADLEQVTEVKAGDGDPNAVLMSIRPLSRLQRTHNWRLLCRDRHGADKLVEDVRKAKMLFEM